MYNIELSNILKLPNFANKYAQDSEQFRSSLIVLKDQVITDVSLDWPPNTSLIDKIALLGVMSKFYTANGVTMSLCNGNSVRLTRECLYDA